MNPLTQALPVSYTNQTTPVYSASVKPTQHISPLSLDAIKAHASIASAQNPLRAAFGTAPRLALIDDANVKSLVSRPQQTSQVDVSALMKQLDSLPGFEMARHRAKKENPSWSTQKLDAAVTEYKKWWVLKKASGLTTPFPMLSDTVDAIWHAHILHTEEYTRESLKFFGEYLHHKPYTTPNAQETSERFKVGVSQFASFANAYEALFGEALQPSWQDAIDFTERFKAQHGS